ncbi:unnamed protein product, partial [Meganyctiphanes norvegica]
MPGEQRGRSPIVVINVLYPHIILLLLTLLLPLPANTQLKETEFDWSSWWSYDGISGPGFWGIINRKWRLCSDGQRQSPVDIDIKNIVYDHNLGEITYSSHKVDGTLTNTGFGLRWVPGVGQTVRIGSGPLHYQYTLAHANLRWANGDAPANNHHPLHGSEHSLQGQYFPAEVQMILYNSDLYKNFTEAMYKPSGLAGLAVLLKVGWRPNPILKIWMDHLHMVPHRGKSTWIPYVPMQELQTSALYLTYEGSLTEPPCEETVTWLVLNKPAYITADQLWQLQSLRRGTYGQTLPISGNLRPVQPINRRTIRTNIPPHSLVCATHQ